MGSERSNIYMPYTIQADSTLMHATKDVKLLMEIRQLIVRLHVENKFSLSRAVQGHRYL